jgi:putative ABC transport system permease protein
MISPVEGLKIAFVTLRANILRSLLTVLGIVIGVAAVMVMVAIGSGARELIGSRIESIGGNLLLITPGARAKSGARMGSGTVHTLTDRDAEAIGSQCAPVASVAAIWGQVAQVAHRGRNWRTRVSGVHRDYFEIRDWEVQYGRFFSEREEKRAAKVCVLGDTVARELFGSTYPIGKMIRVNNVPCSITGVAAPKGQTPRGKDQDDAVWVPLKTAQIRLFGTLFPGQVTAILAQAQGLEEIETAKSQIVALLKERHRIGPHEDPDFTVRNLSELLKAAQESMNIMTTLLAAIAGISLLVGGIGVMNIMLVSVTERAGEIGLRMAVGAKSSDILIQFLIEAALLSMVGGLLGIAAGTTGAYFFARVSGWPVILSPHAALTAMAFSAGVGLFFGLYPAWKAASMEPIDALRRH